MNYIKQLQADNALLHARINATNNAIQDFREHLASPKFVGTETYGERKDWISTSDVNNHLSCIRDALHGIA